MKFCWRFDTKKKSFGLTFVCDKWVFNYTEKKSVFMNLFFFAKIKNRSVFVFTVGTKQTLKIEKRKKPLLWLSKVFIQFLQQIVLMPHRMKLHVLICVQVVDSRKNSRCVDGSMTSFDGEKPVFCANRFSFRYKMSDNSKKNIANSWSIFVFILCCLVLC